MADFFSRIFAIPSDVSSTYSYDDDDDDLRRERRGNRKTRGHARSLTPLSLTDGNNTTSSFGGTLSQASDSLMMERSHDESTNNSVEIEEWSHLQSANNDDNEKYNTRYASKNSSSSRGRRQRRNDVSVRSSSEPRSPNKKTQRSSSMVASPTQQQQRRTNSSNNYGHNMTLQLSSPTKKSSSASRRHRSLSKMGNRRDYDVHESDNNYYDEKDDDISPRRRHRSTSQHKRSSSSHNKRSSSTQHKSSRSKSQQQRMDSNEYSSSNNTNTTKEDNNKSKKDKSNKKEKKKWFKKHFSPGTTSEQGGTPPKTKSKKDVNKKKTAAVSSPRSSSKNYNKKKRNLGDPNNNGGEDGKLRLLPPGQQQRQQPINVGDSIIISQQFLEDNMEMSVLTMPRELKSFDTSSVVLLEGEEDNDKSTSCLDADEIIRMAERDVHEVAGLSSKQTHVHAHIQQEMGLGQSHTVSMEYDKARVYPNIRAYASRILEDSSYSQDKQQQSVTKHGNKQLCGDSPHEMNDDNPLMTMPPPPPPPTPPPLSRSSRRSPTASSTQSSQQQKSSAAAHWNTPGSSNLESQSVVSCDPPGTLVTSPTLMASTDIHDDKLSLTHRRQDPPGDEYSPFDEDSSGLGTSSSMVKPMGVDASPQQEQQPTSSHHRLRSNKAVTFSLPSQTPLPAPPFMGPSLDYYYSMERNTNTPLPCWSNSPLLPPIIELWSSVESSTINDVGDKWDIRQENELLGEETPLIISEKWIDVQDKEWDKAVEEMATNKATEAATATPSTNRIKTSHFLDEDMMAEDEYFDDILNCGEDSSTNVGGVFDNSPSRQSENVPLDDGAVNSRHRSTWNTTYKPPTATSSFYFPEQYNLHDNDNWKRLVRARANAATIIQKSTRGILGRERMRSLMNSTLIIQTSIRRFLSRKRFLDYRKVKRSYYPKRWEKSHNGEERGHNHNRERSMANISVLNLTFD